MAVGPYTSQTIWIAEADDFVIRQFEDVYFVFCKSAGTTHLLNFLTASIVKNAVDKPGNMKDLYDRVLDDLELDTEDCPAELFESSVIQLDEVGLLKPKEYSNA
ncbi:hypothetical protein KFE96_12050 [Kordiimonas sp. SCSIO 12603]|uniref:hypothetical protein n=1 Tax=Kordiimonas sp. SCSIO 12603 TaxID=2829596 RepID=UPI0021067904|nr:hypothetical protein [Kordiimonas sp. SCSIO 12603]UTW57570.1 hypothetical protein KFE96_12050 [Kordiimonas sp. SCSIO 12603]